MSSCRPRSEPLPMFDDISEIRLEYTNRDGKGNEHYLWHLHEYGSANPSYTLLVKISKKGNDISVKTKNDHGLHFVLRAKDDIFTMEHVRLLLMCDSNFNEWAELIKMAMKDYSDPYKTFIVEQDKLNSSVMIIYYELPVRVEVARIQVFHRTVANIRQVPQVRVEISSPDNYTNITKAMIGAMAMKLAINVYRINRKEEERPQCSFPCYMVSIDKYEPADKLPSSFYPPRSDPHRSKRTKPVSQQVEFPSPRMAAKFPRRIDDTPPNDLSVVLPTPFRKPQQMPVNLNAPNSCTRGKRVEFPSPRMAAKFPQLIDDTSSNDSSVVLPIPVCKPQQMPVSLNAPNSCTRGKRVEFPSPRMAARFPRLLDGLTPQDDPSFSESSNCDPCTVLPIPVRKR